MDNFSVEVTFTGVEELAAKLEPGRLLGDATRDLLNQGSVIFIDAAKVNTPVDTGNLRARWEQLALDTEPIPLWAAVGNLVDYGPHVNYGTVPHFPPVAAITPWAKRHNMTPFLVARGIARHGTRGVHMLERAALTLSNRAQELVENAARAVEKRFSE